MKFKYDANIRQKLRQVKTKTRKLLTMRTCICLKTFLSLIYGRKEKKKEKEGC